MEHRRCQLTELPGPSFHYSRADLWTVSIATGIVMLGQGMISPVLPLFAESFGVELAMVGVALSAFAFARLVLNIPLGVATDRWGRRPLLVIGPMVVAAGMLGSALSPSIVMLIVWRFVAGAGSAMYMTAALVYLSDISTPANRARYLAANQAALRLGVSIGPIVGGLMSERFGLRAPFLFVAVSAVLASVHGMIRLQETRPRELRSRRAGPGTWGPLLRSAPFLAVAAVSLAVFLTRSTTRLTLLPLQADSDFGMSPGQIGLVLSAMAGVNLLLLGPAAWLADRFGRRVAIIPSLAGTCVALVLFALADDVGSFLLAAGVLAFVTSISGPATAAFVADITTDDQRGRAFGIFRTAGDLGFLAGPPLLGAVADAGGYGAAYLINGAVVLAIVLGFIFWGRATAVPGDAPPQG
jgi:MFS family permease